MASVTLQKLTIVIDHAANYGVASKQVCTQIAEAMGLSLVTVNTDNTSQYSANYCYNNDLRFQVRLYNSSKSLSYYLLRQDASGALSTITNSSFMSIEYGSDYTFYRYVYLVTAGTLKWIKCISTSTVYGFGFATMVNVYDAKTYPIVLQSSNDAVYPSVTFYTMLEDYSYLSLAKYDVSDKTIPYDGKLYLIPVRYGDTTQRILGSPGEVAYYRLMGTSMMGSGTEIYTLPQGALLSIGGTSVIYMWMYTFIGLE